MLESESRWIYVDSGINKVDVVGKDNYTLLSSIKLYGDGVNCMLDMGSCVVIVCGKNINMCN